MWLDLLCLHNPHDIKMCACVSFIHLQSHHTDAALSFIAVYVLGIFMLSYECLVQKESAIQCKHYKYLYSCVEESHQRSLCKGFPFVLLP